MRARGMLFAAVMLAVPAAQTAPAPPCDDCKYQRCLDSEISRATKMSAMYDRVGKSTQTMDAYKTGTDTEGNRILAEVQAALGDNPDCKTKLPDLTQMSEQRRWQGLGWSIEFDQNKMPHGVGYSAATKIEGGKCVLRESQLDKLKEMLPCLAIGNATEAHERNHVARCENKKIGVPTTPAQMGSFEVEGYKAELKVLKDAKDKLDRKCRRASSSEPDTGERYAQRERLRRAMSRVYSYAATI